MILILPVMPQWDKTVSSPHPKTHAAAHQIQRRRHYANRYTWLSGVKMLNKKVCTSSFPVSSVQWWAARSDSNSASQAWGDSWVLPSSVMSLLIVIGVKYLILKIAPYVLISAISHLRQHPTTLNRIKQTETSPTELLPAGVLLHQWHQRINYKAHAGNELSSYLIEWLGDNIELFHLLCAFNKPAVCHGCHQCPPPKQDQMKHTEAC